LVQVHPERTTPVGTTKILIVEDSKIDARLTRQAIQQLVDWPSRIEIVDDGEKAIKFLRREHSYAAAETPDLVILDLNLPKCDGTEVLRFIRSSEELRNLVVFVFSSSPVDVAEDRMRGAQVSADRYFEKPHLLGTFFSLADQFRESYQHATSSRNGATA
jgi:CheY-like chemotaxis protein